MPKIRRPSRRGTSRRPAPISLSNIVDAEAQAVLDRARRVAACQAEVFAAIAPILARYGCRLGTVQEVVDGQAGPVRVVVMAGD